MFLIRNRVAVVHCRQLTGIRCFCDRPKRPRDDNPPLDYKREMEHPVTRTSRILKNDLKRAANSVTEKINMFRNAISSESRPGKAHTGSIQSIESFVENREKVTMFQSHCDILVIGGGGVGSSIAYWLKKRAREGLSVVVVEKDPTYKEASTSLSLGGLRQQFSLVENIQMSLYGSDFIRNIKEHLGDDVDVNFTPYGYLMMAGTEESAEQLMQNSRLQNELGARNELLTAKRLKEKFPWLNTDGIELGCHGLEKEGWFDPWAMLCAMKRRAIEYGAHYTHGEVAGFEFRSQPDMLVEGVEIGQYESLDRALVKMPDGTIEPIKFAICIIATGAQSGNVARLARIGEGPGMLSVPLPVEPRKRYVYVFSCENEQPGPGLNTPLVIDPTNTYFRREGLTGLYVAGRSPDSIEKEPAIDNLDVDYEYFDTDVWPHLAHRVPKFEAIKVKNAWAGHYEFNTFDENGIIGPHPYYHNLYIATGFSGHGIQQCPAVGRSVAEMIIDGDFFTIDLTRLGFDRIIVDQPMYETNIV